VKEVAYGRTPLGQLLYDLAFTKLSERYLARKYRRPIAEIRKLRDAARRGINGGTRKRRVKP
jgi:hypothetical protein